MDIASIAASIKNDTVAMVFGPEEREAEASLPLFTNAKLRSGLENKNVVYRRGISRYPEVHHTTGVVALYNNLEALKLATLPQIVDFVSDAYGQKEVGLYHGPPAPLLKPAGSGVSAPFVYWFQDLSPGTKYTTVVSLTTHTTEKMAGNLEVLQGFDVYYDLLDAHYDFARHCPGEDILVLDPTWFSLEETQKLISQYTLLYNYFERAIVPLGRPIIPNAVRSLFEKTKIEVPQEPLRLEWREINLEAGKSVLLSSRQALRVGLSKDPNTRVYLQIPLEPRPKGWTQEQSDSLRMSYESGRFGNWAKPGLRRYLRVNETEVNYRSKHESPQVKEERLQFVRDHAQFFGL
jgi:hypothetical protein